MRVEAEGDQLSSKLDVSFGNSCVVGLESISILTPPLCLIGWLMVVVILVVSSHFSFVLDAMLIEWSIFNTDLYCDSSLQDNIYNFWGFQGLLYLFLYPGIGHVLDGSSRGLSTASMPADRAQANQGVGKVPKLIPAVLWGTPARKLGKALSRMARRAKQGQRSSFLFKKMANTRSHSVHWWLSHQRPVRVELHCQTRCNYHPWRQCSLYGLNLQLDSGCGSSHPCLLLDCPKRRELDHHPHRFSELATKSGMGKPRLECVSGWQPPSKTPVVVLSWTCQSERKWPSR